MNKISEQPNFNLGTFGSVSSGKSTLIAGLTGVLTQRSSYEKTRNMTFKAGYANAKIWEDPNGNLYSTNSNVNEFKNDDNEDCNLIKYFSFVDCPGHQELTKIMLGQVELMQGGVVVISAAENILENKQLKEHLYAAKLSNINKLIVCLNKCDLVSKEIILKKKNEIERLFSNLELNPLTIIPTSFNMKFGINYLLKAINIFFSVPKHKLEKDPFFYISRSFNVNQPGTKFEKLKGGVVGGSLIEGRFSVGDKIMIKPGIIAKVENQIKTFPIITTIKSIKSDNNSLKSIIPGGLVALQLDIDPHFTKKDGMVGSVVGKVDSLPDVYNNITLKVEILDDNYKFKVKSQINLQIGPLDLIGLVTKVEKKNKIDIQLQRPCCIKKENPIYLSTSINKRTNIIGKGQLL